MKIKTVADFLYAIIIRVLIVGMEQDSIPILKRKELSSSSLAAFSDESRISEKGGHGPPQMKKGGLLAMIACCKQRDTKKKPGKVKRQ